MKVFPIHFPTEFAGKNLIEKLLRFGDFKNFRKISSCSPLHEKTLVFSSGRDTNGAYTVRESNLFFFILSSNSQNIRNFTTVLIVKTLGTSQQYYALQKRKLRRKWNKLKKARESKRT